MTSGSSRFHFEAFTTLLYGQIDLLWHLVFADHAGEPTVLRLYPLAVSLKGARAGNTYRQVSYSAFVNLATSVSAQLACRQTQRFRTTRRSRTLHSKANLPA